MYYPHGHWLCCMSTDRKNGLTPFRSAVPFWGQTTWNLTGLSPKRDCDPKRVKVRNTTHTLWSPVILQQYSCTMSYLLLFIKTNKKIKWAGSRSGQSVRRVGIAANQPSHHTWHAHNNMLVHHQLAVYHAGGTNRTSQRQPYFYHSGLGLRPERKLCCFVFLVFFVFFPLYFSFLFFSSSCFLFSPFFFLFFCSSLRAFYFLLFFFFFFVLLFSFPFIRVYIKSHGKSSWCYLVASDTGWHTTAH